MCRAYCAAIIPIFIAMIALALLASAYCGKKRDTNPTQRSMVAFTAEWCGPCKRAKQILGRLVKDGFEVEIVDIDRSPGRAKRAGVRSVPTFFIYEGPKFKLVLRTQNMYTAAKSIRNWQ